MQLTTLRRHTHGPRGSFSDSTKRASVLRGCLGQVRGTEDKVRRGWRSPTALVVRPALSSAREGHEREAHLQETGADMVAHSFISARIVMPASLLQAEHG